MTTASSETESVVAGDKLAYTIADAARAISIGRSTLYKFLQSGELASVSLGARRLILAEDLERFVRARRQTDLNQKVA